MGNEYFREGKFQSNKTQSGLGLSTAELTSPFSIAPSAKYSSGARTVLRINENIVGFAFGISWRINTMATEIRTIDDYLPHELAPSMISIEGTMNTFRVPGHSASYDEIQANMLSFLFHKYITIEVRDSATDQLLLYVPKAIVVSRVEDIRAEAVTTVQLSWKAIGWKDELEPTVKHDGGNASTASGLIAGVQKTLSNAADAITNKIKKSFK